MVYVGALLSLNIMEMFLGENTLAKIVVLLVGINQRSVCLSLPRVPPLLGDEAIKISHSHAIDCSHNLLESFFVPPDLELKQALNIVDIASLRGYRQLIMMSSGLLHFGQCRSMAGLRNGVVGIFTKFVTPCFWKVYVL